MSVTSMIDTLALAWWTAVTFGTARWWLGRSALRPVPCSLYKMWQPTRQADAVETDISRRQMFVFAKIRGIAGHTKVISFQVGITKVCLLRLVTVVENGNKLMMGNMQWVNRLSLPNQQRTLPPMYYCCRSKRRQHICVGIKNRVKIVHSLAPVKI